MVASASVLRPGDTLGGFRVDDVIGIGGMAIVYRAEQVSLGRPVALKVLSKHLTEDATFRERFRREGMHAAALEHPHIVPVYDSGEQDGVLYLAMRLVEGTNLAEMIQRPGLSADRAIELLRPIASALDSAHAAGLIHRDVKPQNILITNEGHPYLADFGVAKGSNTLGLTATGGFLGSVNYASPEQIKGLTLTPASDVYALTAVLYHCLSGSVPYARETDASIMHAHLTEPPPALPEITGAGSDFHTVLARGMAKDPGARYGHAGDLINAAALAVSRLPTVQRKAVPAFPREDSASAEREGASPAAEIGGDSFAAVRAALEVTSADERRAPPPPPPVAEPRRGFRALALWRTRRRALMLGAGAVAAVAIALACVLLLGSSGGGAKVRKLRTGHLVVFADPRLHRDDAAAVEGLPTHNPILLAAGHVNVDAGMIGAPHGVAASVPPQVSSRYGKPTQTSLLKLPAGPARAYTFSGHATTLRLVVFSTEAGELAIACDGSPSHEVGSTCAGLGEKAQVIGTKVVYPGVDPILARKLRAALRTGGAIPSTLAAMKAKSMRARMGQSTRIVHADRLIASRLHGLSGPRRDIVAIAGLSRAFAAHAKALAQSIDSARHGNRAGYQAVRKRTVGVAHRLLAAARALAALGFAVPTMRGMVLPSLPTTARAAAKTTVSAPGGYTPPAGVPSSEGSAERTAPAPATTAPAPTTKTSPAPQESPKVIVSAPK